MAFLADHAVAHDDGRVYVTGGGIDRLALSTFPSVYPQLALVLKVHFTEGECGREHIFQIRALDPSGRQFLPLFGLAVIPERDPTRQDQLAPFQFVYRMHDILLHTEGNYRFSIELDNLEVATISLSTERSATAAAQTGGGIDTLSRALDLGYATFIRGNVAEAQAIFERLADRFPRSPDAHNNVGFTLLAQSSPREALPAFERALEHGTRHPELVRANIACCLYFLGNAKDAFVSFQSLLKLPVAFTHATLFALGRSQATGAAAPAPRT